VETIKRQTRATCAVWLQAKVHYRGLGLRPRQYAGSVCVDSAAEAECAAIGGLYKDTSPFYLIFN